MTETNNLPIVIFENGNGGLEITLDQNQETVWLSQAQIAHLFSKDRTVITKHINNIFKDSEVEEKSNVQKMHFPNSDKPTNVYSLDVVLAVGYKTSSARAIAFRKWVTKVLKEHLIKGYSLNQKLLQNKSTQIDEICKTLDFLVKGGKIFEISDKFLSILNQYTNSLIVLNQYDENRLNIAQGVAGVKVEIQEFRDLIQKTKEKLIQNKEATDLFGKEYEGKFDGTIGAVYQTFAGSDLYPSLDEKAANLLYLVIKNHSFVDGNKRIGSILFVYFLAKNNYLIRPNGESKINDNTLVALALLVAQSKPEEKEILVKLIIKLLQ
jgi:prophage maintenance system killer protein/prophage antirepressor-like protein